MSRIGKLPIALPKGIEVTVSDKNILTVKGRVERSPLKIPKGVEIDIQKKLIKVKGVKGTLECPMEQDVEVVLKDSELKFAPKGSLNFAIAIAGTLRALVKNMIVGVSEGYTRKLVLEGVGYRAQVQGNVLIPDGFLLSEKV